MSHFSVLVIGDNVERQLAPFHEFECTGTDDEFVQSIDVTAEARALYASRTVTRIKLPDGTLQSFFDEHGKWREEFSQVEDRIGTSRDYYVPPGHEQVEVPCSQAESFLEFATSWYGREAVPNGTQPDLTGEHKFGHIQLNDAGEIAQIVRRTNPNNKWDWYQIGGRWSGFFRLKPGATNAKLGERSLLDREPDDRAGKADCVRKGDIDFEAMRNAAGEKAAAKWHMVQSLTGGATWISWEEFQRAGAPVGGLAAERVNIDAAREFYHNQPAVAVLKKHHRNFSWEIDPDLRGLLHEFVAKARDRAITTFAVVYNCEWTEKGSMGWFGMVADEQDQGQWNRLYNDLIDGMPDDTLLTVVDCHI